MSRPKILVVDDKENFLKLFERILGERYALSTAGSGTQALEKIAAEPFDLVLSDIRMPGADGFEVLRAVKRRSPRTQVILMTAFASVPKAVEAMREGAWDYLQKPFDPDDVALLIARALSQPSPESVPLGGLIGSSAALKEFTAQLEKAGGLELTVLLQGESGTGKELAAKALHQRSPRAAKPFIAVNCGALPAELAESELFGHARGAFTGADVARAGLFEAAEGGTIFLDEIGDLPLALQVKLNRVLQEREVRRVGDTRSVPLDVRVIAATHRELKAEVAAGRFREDLFYRLSVLPLRLPPLRERGGDVALLAAHFLQKHARRPLAFTAEAMAALEAHAFPGNVRELENVIARAAALSTGETLGLDLLPSEITGGARPSLDQEALSSLPYREAIERSRNSVSKEYLVALLRDFGGNVTRAAERAGMERESLHRLLKRYGVRSDEFKRSE